MKVQAQAQFLMHSPYKVRRVLDLVRGLPVEEARKVRVGVNSPSLWPTIDSVM